MECSYWPDLLLGPDCVTTSLLATGWATEVGLAGLSGPDRKAALLAGLTSNLNPDVHR